MEFRGDEDPEPALDTKSSAAGSTADRSVVELGHRPLFVWRDNKASKTLSPHLDLLGRPARQCGPAQIFFG
jgi:hypothetical protein